MNPIESQRFLIIAGSAKAGTTALFETLARHPVVCPAVEKEIGFFADSDLIQGRSYSHLPNIRFEDGPEAYAAFFPDPNRGSKVCLESTGLYMHSIAAPGRIRDTLPRARVLFMLRNPLEKFVSLFRFQKQLGWVPIQVTLEEYFNGCRASGRFDRFGLNPLRVSIDVASLLEQYFQALPAEFILVEGYADFREDSITTLERIARFAGLDPEPLTVQGSREANRTHTIRHARLHDLYLRATEATYRQRHRFPQAIRVARKIHLKTTRRLYFGINGRTDEETRVPGSVQAHFDEALGAQEARLEALVGRAGCLRTVSENPAPDALH